MKQLIIIFTAIILLAGSTNAQFFQGSFQKDVADVMNLKISFKLKSTAAINTQIAYMEAAFRFPTATTPAFTITNISSNTTAFPGLAFQRLTPDYSADGFTYFRFVFNTAIVPANTYAAGAEYDLFSITTSLPAAAVPVFEMISNLDLELYQFGTVNGLGVFMSPGSSNQLFGPGFYKSGSNHILPLFAGPLPVLFTNFTLVKKDNDALLQWDVANQDASTSHYEIERSSNGMNFEKVMQVAADLAIMSYTATDAGITSFGKNILYYRIKQVDKDGRFVYTAIKNIKLLQKGNAAGLHPNPANQMATLSFYLEAKDKVTISVIDASGKVMEASTITGIAGNNQVKLQLERFSPGSYKVVVKKEGGSETLKLVIVR